MRIAFITVIGLHGIIHLFGFLKAFGLSEFNAISEPISKPFGIIWLLTFILFAVVVFLLSIQSHYWWKIGSVGVIISQFLILNYWSDAKFGTIVNLIIFVSIVLAYLTFRFKSKVSDETAKMFENSNTIETYILTEKMISGLPAVVQKWLLNSGTIGKEAVCNIYIEQDLQMLMKPEQKDWSNAKAKQYFTIEPPAFNWSVNLKMNPLLDVVGRDKFENGQGEMTIKLFSLFPIANAKNNQKVNQATLQRYLAEIVWFPSSALSHYISWETIDEYSAKATMEYRGTKGSGVFHFDETGNFKKFVAMRYKDANDTEATEWTVTANKTEERNGIKIPVELKAEWKLENHNWTWLKLKITAIKYNLRKMPEA
ncbi:hypothetical protein MKJ04_00370 [Pontibacter sp. E15-1]|uniref:DUF6920 family protein n=1 Tax=Pontibacter sp. E15-1 TaxID=2919918 RepID=UPI001F4F32FE|nr:DUF6544 family protein [Pontibacter sp. E15-1]MCJ8163276.1 hypothetical protein [Pontibacter sp. E15-1]